MGFAEMGICMEHVDILKPTTKFTLAMLADRADPFSDSEKTQRRTDGRVECWPSVTDLVHRTNQSKSTVLRQLKELEKLGIIEVEKRWRKDASGRARQTTNRYILNLPEMLEGKFRKGNCALGVKSTPKQSYPQNAGHGKSVDLTPIGGLGVKNADSMGVTVDTPIKDQGLTTIPSPQPPTESGASGTAAPSGAEPAGSAGEGSSLQWTDRLAAISLALIGQGRLPEGVTDAELVAVRALQAQDRTNGDSGESEALENPDGVITPVEATGPSEGPTGPYLAPTGPERDPADSEELSSEGLDGSQPGGGDGDSLRLSDVDAVELARRVLPAPMQAMGPTHLAKVGGELAKRLEAGWLPEQITAILASRQLPSQVRNLVALVLARLRDDVPVDQPPPAGTDWSAEPSDSPSSQRWSHTLADGRVVTHKDLDCGLLAIDFNHARQSGDWAGDDRMAFAVAVGIERYLTS